MKYATLIVSLLIIIAVLIPGSNLPDVGLGGLDKIVHIGMFATWAVAVRHDFYNQRFNFFSLFLAGLVFSLITELVQLMVEGRTFDFYDMLADAIGLLIGLTMSGPILKLVSKMK
jgi:VanZ family protein